mmetsp:Transcript_31971/g.23634  ORF Transcript_31971/g.23634 Transcript_31971/m.23634 type:complete len:81 (-) Transcript_31971:177-419(-)
MQEFESRYRKEQMLSQKLMNKKECVFCRFVSAMFFGVLGGAQIARLQHTWKYYPRREKVFNILALTGVFALALLNLNAGY